MKRFPGNKNVKKTKTKTTTISVNLLQLPLLLLYQTFLSQRLSFSLPGGTHSKKQHSNEERQTESSAKKMNFYELFQPVHALPGSTLC